MCILHFVLFDLEPRSVSFNLPVELFSHSRRLSGIRKEESFRTRSCTGNSNVEYHWGRVGHNDKLQRWYCYHFNPVVFCLLLGDGLLVQIISHVRKHKRQIMIDPAQKSFKCSLIKYMSLFAPHYESAVFAK